MANICTEIVCACYSRTQFRMKIIINSSMNFRFLYHLFVLALVNTFEWLATVKWIAFKFIVRNVYIVLAHSSYNWVSQCRAFVYGVCAFFSQMLSMQFKWQNDFAHFSKWFFRFDAFFGILKMWDTIQIRSFGAFGAFASITLEIALKSISIEIKHSPSV